MNFREIEVAINPEPYKEINLDEVQFPDIMILKGLILQSLEGKVDEEYFLSRVTDLIYKSFDNVS